MTDVTVLTYGELLALKGQVDAELTKRERLEALPAQMESLNVTYLAQTGVAAGSPWRQPTGPLDSYPVPFTVTHGGKMWENLTPWNVWEPGVSGWREVVPPEAPPAAWVQPTGAHDAYAVDAQVTHNGFVWTSLVPANVWEPTDANSTLWQKGAAV